MAGMVGDFMSDWRSKFFRERILAQIEEAKVGSNPDPQAEDPMEQFLAHNTGEQLERFIYEKSKQREDYLGFAADLLVSLRQCKGRPGMGRENLNMPGETIEDSSLLQEDSLVDDSSKLDCSADNVSGYSSQDASNDATEDEPSKGDSIDDEPPKADSQAKGEV